MSKTKKLLFVSDAVSCSLDLEESPAIWRVESMST